MSKVTHPSGPCPPPRRSGAVGECGLQTPPLVRGVCQQTAGLMHLGVVLMDTWLRCGGCQVGPSPGLVAVSSGQGWLGDTRKTEPHGLKRVWQVFQSSHTRVSGGTRQSPQLRALYLFCMSLGTAHVSHSGLSQEPGAILDLKFWAAGKARPLQRKGASGPAYRFSRPEP